MKITITGLKKLALGCTTLPLFTILALNIPSSATTRGAVQEQDVAATYKKCAGCHGQKAEKSFDAAKPDEQLTETILKGVKGKMPPYEKSINAEQAKALVAHMKQLKGAAAAPAEAK